MSVTGRVSNVERSRQTGRRRVPAPQTQSRRQTVNRVRAASGYAEGSALLAASPTSHAPEATRLNSQTPSRDIHRQDLPPQLRLELERKGYIIYAANSLEVLNERGKENPDRPLREVAVGRGGNKAVVSGTFYDQTSGQPVGAVMRDGRLDTPGVEKAKERGGVAILQDGTIVVGRMAGNTTASIQKEFGSPENPVRDFMGGGALLIENSKVVSSEDLRTRQRFDQGSGGIRAQQMRQTDHVLVGIRQGRCFVIVAKNKTGKTIQDDLSKAGFTSLVKFDGGSGAYARDSKGVRTRGKNPTGFAVR